ncbi:HAMP domain-containing sensor histidine kinase [Desulfosporosinus sp. BG]|uniref:sensor histidine kinase n=1 Tax=Desulfosporosinus sp. BG TaxID=1633135 RepID=UPI00083A6EAF|nr:HAMP domain-containing sensor histidine kinase [Desulfosporosinus sp. BG]ODA39119.1 Signal transduction histidine kinase [Desulfosporosinus sp. BG]
MKLKIKLPLLFLLVFVLIIFPGTLFIKTLITTATPKSLRIFPSLLHFEVIFYLLFLTGLVFVILAIYLHFTITKPLQLLNTRLNGVNIRRPISSLSSRRKDEIGELYNHFNDMEDRLHRAHKEQIGMIAAMAHDLKTPLTTINGFVELLAMQKNLSEREKQEFYELILKKTKHIAELINAFSSFTKDELELEAINMKSYEARKLFENIAAEYEIELSGFNFELDWNHTFTANQHILINEHMIRRVFGNLFSNAVRYVDKRDLKVYMSGYVQGNNAYFLVEDNGLGVLDKELPLLFLKFFTVDKSRQNKSGGMGLGLASCKSIIEHHGGGIDAFHSSYGGLGIRFYLPLMK